MRKIVLALFTLVVLACAKEAVAPPQQVEGLFAKVANGMSYTYISLERGIFSLFMSPETYIFADGSFLNIRENTFKLVASSKYSIVDNQLITDDVDYYGVITLNGDELSINEKTFVRVKSLVPVLNKTSLSLYVGASESLVATVFPSDAKFVWSSTNESVATVDDNGRVTAIARGTADIYVKAVNGDKTAKCSVSVITPSVPIAVDLGLSVKWASFNLGASTPEGYGDYYAWGATVPWYNVDSQSLLSWNKDGGYSESNCPFNGGYNDYNYSYWNAHKSECVDADGVLLPANDAAHVNLGGNWRMPTAEEFDELLNTSNCYWYYTRLNDVYGYIVQSMKPGYTSNWIFLPLAGYWDYTRPKYGSQSGWYWSSSISAYDDYYNDYYYWNAGMLFIGLPASAVSQRIDRGCELRHHGLSVRPVTK